MEHLIRLIEHLAWADQRTLGALDCLPSIEPKILGMYAHILGAEHIWLTRLQGISAIHPVWPVFSLAECRQVAAENAAGLRAVVASLGPAGLEADVTYTNTAGITFTSTGHDILLHVCLHGQYHRGQVAAAVRAAGGNPSPTDFIFYVRGSATATRTDRTILRTPEERFENLPGYPFAPHYVSIDGIRLHYVDEGPSSGEVVLLLHGEPTWSYLYRKMIPILADAGLRVIAPDLVGFGKSDKLPRREDYSYALHVDLLKQFVTTLDLKGVTLFGQDWGGLLGLRVAAELSNRFGRIVAANTGLPNGTAPINPAFFQWREYSQKVPVFSAGKIVHKGTVNGIDPSVAAAYDAPYPDESYLAGARAFPMLVPVGPDDPAVGANLKAWEVLRSWTKPFLTAFSDQDPIMAGGERVFQTRVPGAANQTHPTVIGAAHFLQEDRGEELARLVIGFVRANPPNGGR